MNGRPAHEPRISISLFAPFPGLPGFLPAPCWACWQMLALALAVCKSRPCMRGRRGHQGPHRGQGSRQVALGLDAQVICIPMRFCRRLRGRDSRTYRYRTGSGRKGNPKLHTTQVYTRCPPPSPCDLDLTHSSTKYIFQYISSCTHMRQTALSGFTTSCSPAVSLSVCLPVCLSACLSACLSVRLV